MLYRIYKVTGRIGTAIEKTDAGIAEMRDLLDVASDHTSIAAYDDETNTIHVFNDRIIDVSSIEQKLKNHCNLPNKHQFTIERK